MGIKGKYQVANGRNTPLVYRVWAKGKSRARLNELSCALLLGAIRGQLLFCLRWVPFLGRSLWVA